MKSLQEYISEQMVCELSSKLLSDASVSAKDKGRKRQANKFAKGAGKALERELKNGEHKKTRFGNKIIKGATIGGFYKAYSGKDIDSEDFKKWCNKWGIYSDFKPEFKSNDDFIKTLIKHQNDKIEIECDTNEASYTSISFDWNGREYVGDGWEADSPIDDLRKKLGV